VAKKNGCEPPKGKTLTFPCREMIKEHKHMVTTLGDAINIIKKIPNTTRVVNMLTTMKDQQFKELWEYQKKCGD
jgi:hypothetical protein